MIGSTDRGIDRGKGGASSHAAWTAHVDGIMVAMKLPIQARL